MARYDVFAWVSDEVESDTCNIGHGWGQGSEAAERAHFHPASNQRPDEEVRRANVEVANDLQMQAEYLDGIFPGAGRQGHNSLERMSSYCHFRRILLVTEADMHPMSNRAIRLQHPSSRIAKRWTRIADLRLKLRKAAALNLALQKSSAAGGLPELESILCQPPLGKSFAMARCRPSTMFGDPDGISCHAFAQLTL
jgi:hypothetical protein